MSVDGPTVYVRSAGRWLIDGDIDIYYPVGYEQLTPAVLTLEDIL